MTFFLIGLTTGCIALWRWSEQVIQDANEEIERVKRQIETY